MTVSSTSNRKTFAGDGVTVAFGTSPIVFFDAIDLLVYKVVTATGVATLQTITTDYTVSGGAGSTGTVTAVVAPAVGETYVIVRSVAATQSVDLVNNDGSDAEVIEDALDRLTMIAQDRDAKHTRTLRQPVNDPNDISELPGYVARASKYLAFDASGNPVATNGTANAFVVSAFAETLLDDGSAAAMRSTLGVPASSEAVLNSAFTAKGGLLVGTGSGTKAELAVGANGTIPMAKSGATTGIAWVAPKKYIYGWTYGPGSDGAGAGDATNDIRIAAGGGLDATDAYWIEGGALVKQSDAAWAVGTNQGGLDLIGSAGNNAFYIWAIARSDTGVVDYLFSLSSTAPTMPANYDYKRLIGWFVRIGGSIVQFRTREIAGGGIYFLYYTIPAATTFTATVTTTGTGYDARVPAALPVEARVRIDATDAASAFRIAVRGNIDANTSASASAAPLSTFYGFGTGSAVWEGEVLTEDGTVNLYSTLATVDTVLCATVGFKWGRR